MSRPDSDDTPSRLSALEVRVDQLEQTSRDLLTELRSINNSLQAMRDVFARKSGVMTGIIIAGSAITAFVGFVITGTINWFR